MAPSGSSSRCRRSSTSPSGVGPSFLAGVATQDPEVVGTLLEAFAHTWAGTSPEQFDGEVREWLKTVKQPNLGVPYVELVYKPMLELLDLLAANEFRVFVCSGGGRDLMRVFAEETGASTRRT
jgi:phosphoserine phosphatase